MIKANTDKSKTTKFLLVLSIVLAFMLVFSDVLKKDWSLIFKKFLYHHDESVQSAVPANLTRKLFPPMVRVNPFIESQQIIVTDGRKKSLWMEGPQWQHLPPLFLYVPVPFFWFDNQITIEVRRLSYELIALLTGILLIFTVYFFEKTLTAAVSAALAAVFWIYTPMTRQLITGLHFGISNIVLAFTVICSFSAVCLYLSQPAPTRRNYSLLRLIFIALFVSLPIMTKNLLGAIPAATFFFLLLYDQRRVNLRLAAPVAAFLVFLTMYYGPLYLSSSQTFMAEFFISFEVFSSNFEGWQRPWHFFITNYLPQFYLGNFWYPYVITILAGAIALVMGVFKGRSRTILALSIIWFAWNLLAVSLSTAKAPGYILQTYSLSLFFGIYSLLLLITQPAILQPLRSKLNKALTARPLLYTAVCLLTVMVLFTGKTYGGLINRIEETRAQPYDYQSLREKFYRFGEIARQHGANTQDIFVLDASKEDYWFRYYIIFLTGAEAVTITDIMPSEVGPDYLKSKYFRLNFVFDKNRKIPDFLAAYKGFDCPDFTVVTVDLRSTDFTVLQRNLSLFIDESSRDKDAIDLYDLKNNYAFTKLIDPENFKRLENKCRQSLSQYQGMYAAGKQLTIFDHRWTKLDAGKYKFDFLLRVNKAFEEGWTMCLVGHVKDEHIHYLSEQEQEFRARIWWIEPVPPFTAWPADDYIMISEIVDADPIPYFLQIGFLKPYEAIGGFVDLGLADLSKSTGPTPTD